MDNEPAAKILVPKATYLLGAVSGALAAFIALPPVSGVKTYLIFVRLCFPLTADIFDAPISPTTCGLFLNTWDTTPTISSIYVLGTVLGGAIAGLWAARARINKPLLDPQGASQRPRVFWWSFGAGVLFDVLFVFVFLYLGQ